MAGETEWTEVAAWDILLPEDLNRARRNQAIKTMQRALDRLPGIVDGLV